MARKPAVDQDAPEPVTTSVIEICNAGRVIQRTITLPPRGGVVVLMGENEAGKSTCLDAVSELCGKRTDLQRNYAADMAEITLRTPKGEHTVKIHATQKRHSGADVNALEVVHIEDKLDVSDLVDPGFEDPESQDLARIKTLVQMSGAKVGWADFEALKPPPFPGAEPVSLDKARTVRDTVGQAKAVQAIFYAEKRRYQELEKEARDEQSKATAAVGELDLTAVHDAAVLQASYREALTTHTRLLEQQQAADKARQARDAAAVKLEQQRGAYRGLTIAAAEQAVAAAQAEVTTGNQQLEAANALVLRLEQELLAARHAAQLAAVESRSRYTKLSSAQSQLQAAKDHEQAILDMTGLLSKTLPEPPDADAIEMAALELEQAQAAMDLGVTIREALQKKKRADEFAAKAEVYRVRAEAYEQAGLATNDLLSKAVNVPGFKVVGGQRLLYVDEGREELYQVLSKGKRAIEAIKVGARAVSEKTGSGTKLLRLDQDIWQDLDPRHRDLVAEIAMLEEITILTAQCSSGPLRQVIYGEPDSWTDGSLSTSG